MKTILYSLIISLFTIACTPKQPTQEGLPYYNTPDFTPIWIADKVQLDTIHTLAPFAFKNQNGESITPQTFKGKIHVMNCFFSICPSLCPRLMSSMQIVQQAFKNDPKVLIASYSVTPERDSVSVLRTYATAHKILDGKWHLLTGNKKEIYDIARHSYYTDENLGIQKGENDFLHTENFILVDKNLHIRGIYNGTLQLEMEQLIRDIRELEKE